MYEEIEKRIAEIEAEFGKDAIDAALARILKKMSIRPSYWNHRHQFHCLLPN